MATGRGREPLAWAAAALLGAAALGVAVRAAAADVRGAERAPSAPYATSAGCQACHPDHDASWRRTFHRTMTQQATPASVVGDFSGREYRALGVTSRFLRQDDRFFIETLDGQGAMRRHEVARTVGSRRFQQYLTREGDRYLRLPLAWNIEERRWLHLGAGFLDPDGTDFNRHRSLWDGNCIFCHNTGPQPGYDWERSRFDSRVEELGIACEACHGPGSSHADRNRNPVRRYWLHFTGEADGTIVTPTRLSPARSVQVCGHCHGQRLPHPSERIRQFMSEGDPFRPGDDLGTYTQPLKVDSSLPGVDVTARFWKDGTPRLTAYEYQGLLMSKDFKGGAEGGLTCGHCHRMHEGDPKGMLPPEMRGPAACASCHADLVARAAEHSGHRAGGSGTDCYACHLPKITYGLLGMHPTHRIQDPEPSRAWRYQMPEACTLCHTDRSARWAAESWSRMFKKPVPEDLPEETVAESLRALLGGDVVQRAAAAESLGDERSYAEDPRARLWAVPFLAVAMERDSYPAVRHLAERSARRVIARAAARWPELEAQARSTPDFDPMDEPARRAAVAGWYRRLWEGLDRGRLPRPDASVPLDERLLPVASVIDRLGRTAPEPAVSIGE
ncbi:MAG TPA: cytochrome c3 family protein [Myxococcaceae bacterium]|jgi:predicted CXXCH cytochrome family protein